MKCAGGCGRDLYLAQNNLGSPPDHGQEVFCDECFLRELEERTLAKKAKEEDERMAARIAHERACMSYDDAYAQRTYIPWRERIFRCKFGFHRSRWSPRWKKGTYGFCTLCGVDTGGGIDDCAGY